LPPNHRYAPSKKPPTAITAKATAVARLMDGPLFMALTLKFTGKTAIVQRSETKAGFSGATPC
jgi:hypothetical protein